MAISLCHKNIPISSITFFELAFCETLDNKANWGHNRKRKLLYGRSHLSSKSSKILNVKNPRFLHSI